MMDIQQVEQIEQYSPDVTALHAVDKALESQSNFNRLLQRRRFLANQLRVKANELDSETNLMWEEYNEISPIPFDYEPVQPIANPQHKGSPAKSRRFEREAE